MEEEIRYWDRVRGFVTELDIDARWILRSNIDDMAHGSLRIVSHPDLKPGYLKAFCSFVISRKPKSPEEIEQSVEDFKMDVVELEVYSVNEHIVTKQMPEYIAPKRDIEKTYNVKIFE